MLRSGESKLPRLSKAQGKATCQHVLDTFKRVLERSPDVHVTTLDDEPFPTVRIECRGHRYQMIATTAFSANKDEVRVFVNKLDGTEAFMPTTFFKYKCPAIQLGKLRKAALILLKKINLREVHDVMQA